MLTSASSNPRVSLICVGSELLRGKINTHASTLARRLAAIGLELAEEHTVGDDLPALTDAIRRALRDTRLVIVTGGLGPTFDDLTREAAADASGRPLVFSPKLLREIAMKFRKARLRAMPPANKRQAFLVRGASPIPNHVGTAPGQWLALNGKVLLLLPGPPSELQPMLEGWVLPKLKTAFSTIPRAEAHLHFVGLPESVVDERIRPIIKKEASVEFTILAHLGLVDFDIFVADASRSRAVARLKRIVRKVRAKMGAAFYGMDADDSLEKVVMKKFVAHRATLALAESCTGGMLAERLTDVAGSSKFFLGGVVSYSDRVKRESLGVPADILRAHGAVSAQTAMAMAKGARERLGSQWAVSITGIAGPAGGTPSKPIGLVYMGVAGPQRTKTHTFHFRGTRAAIRQRSVLAALNLLRQIYL